MRDYRAAEFSVIGAILIDERCFPAVREVLTTPEVFSNDHCRRAFEAICDLSEAQKPIDPVTVGQSAGLENRFLAECMQLAPSCAAAGEYARAVADGFRRRMLLGIGERLQADAFSMEAEADQVLEDARSRLDELANQGRSFLKATGDSLRDFLCFRAEVNEGKRQTVKLGFPSLDGILGGFAQGGLYIVAARPGVGKSALGIAAADMLARKHRVLYASLEMSEEELNARRIAAFCDAGITFGRLLFGQTNAEEDASVLTACGVLSQRKLQILAVSSLSVAELGVQARNAGVDVVIVDYLGLLSGADRKASEYERTTQISGDLKRLAKRLGCVVIALCQLNRESANSPGSDKLPRLSQLRSSGAIEQDADGVLLLHRPEYGQTEVQRSPAEPQQFFVDVAKNRHGRTGTIELAWYAPVNRFEDRGGKWIAKSWA